MVRALREGEGLREVPGPLTSTCHPRGPPPTKPTWSSTNNPQSHMVSPRPQPALQPLTQHIDVCGGGHSGHSIAGGALPAPIGLLGQRSQDEATVAVHLGLALQPPAHLRNHWSALRTHAATPHQGQLRFPPYPDSDGPLLPTERPGAGRGRGLVGTNAGRTGSGALPWPRR